MVKELDGVAAMLSVWIISSVTVPSLVDKIDVTVLPAVVDGVLVIDGPGLVKMTEVDNLDGGILAIVDEINCAVTTRLEVKLNSVTARVGMDTIVAGDAVAMLESTVLTLVEGIYFFAVTTVVEIGVSVAIEEIVDVVLW